MGTYNMLFGNITREITIIFLIIVLILTIISGYFIFENKKLNNEKAMQIALDKEREKYGQLEESRSIINKYDDNQLNDWLQSNDGLR